MATGRCGKHPLSISDCLGNSAATADDFDFGHVRVKLSAVHAEFDWESTTDLHELEREIRVSTHSGHLDIGLKDLS